MIKKILISIFLICNISFLYASTNIYSPKINREFRGAWVATVHNIDWPSEPGLSVDQQKQEILNILNTLQQAHLNAVILQVRPQADAFYKSNFEPWSEFITGEQDKNPGYDPLKFWINEAHKRGIELHAWFNPYRANINSKNLPDIPNNAIVKLKTDNFYWFVPTVDVVRKHTLKVIIDVVKNYDIDGVHMDDYFYPYPSDCPDAGFPDQEFYQEYISNGGTLELDAWRREAVNILIKDLAREIKQAKPYVKFGISPFGIWRPGHPKGIEADVDSFKDLAADSKKWINAGWVDYLAPQLYWPIEQTPQSFKTLLDWWMKQNYKNHNIWPGLYTSREVTKGSVGTDEIVNQIKMTRDKLPTEKAGHIHFSMIDLLNNTANMTDILESKVYQQLAITPNYSNITSSPQRPELNYDKKSKELTISFPDLTQTIAVFTKDKNKGWSINYYPAYNKKEITLTIKNTTEQVEVKLMDRYGNLSESNNFYFTDL
ncbi:glycoside hydrolase family 10 protein [Candidatus Francisella endociliophora]|uniref:glycoside hydrolase family 10 protein n=1 Tax=Candidatus Francisella endociliophora TaxID=653937 RepID=UPI000694137B|nr:family 10 glycosylhydrolase [Francisella sp. FSC1006]